MLDIAKMLWECQRERHIFIFRDCSESRMYKRFLKKWDENYFEGNMQTMFDKMLYYQSCDIMSVYREGSKPSSIDSLDYHDHIS